MDDNLNQQGAMSGNADQEIVAMRQEIKDLEKAIERQDPPLAPSTMAVAEAKIATFHSQFAAMKGEMGCQSLHPKCARAARRLSEELMRNALLGLLEVAGAGFAELPASAVPLGIAPQPQAKFVEQTQGYGYYRLAHASSSASVEKWGAIVLGTTGSAAATAGASIEAEGHCIGGCTFKAAPLS